MISVQVFVPSNENKKNVLQITFAIAFVMVVVFSHSMDFTSAAAAALICYRFAVDRILQKSITF